MQQLMIAVRNTKQAQRPSTTAGLAAAVTVFLAASAVSRAAVVFDFSLSGPANQSGVPYVLANEFTVNSPITVAAMGAYSESYGGQANKSVNVAIFKPQAGGWGEVAATSVWVANSGTKIDGSYWQNLSLPVTLEPGTYAVVESTGGSDRVGIGVPVGTANTLGGALSFGSIAFWAGSFGAYSPIYTTIPNGWVQYLNVGQNVPAYAGGTFQASPVPEPATLTAGLGAGLLALAALVRRPRR